MEVEVWADIVCPWCYIGKRKLELAIAQSKRDVKVVARAFQLDPSAESNGQRTTEMLARKYRMGAEQVQQMMQRVTAVAAEVGLTYRLEQTLTGNTRMAHRLLKHGGAPAWERLYKAYFTEGRSVFDAPSLQSLADEIGLAGAAEVLASDRYADEVDADLRMAQEIGVSGVPFFVFDRRVAVSGAQPVEVLVQALLSH